jgi:WD40 repeat protein
LVASLALAGAIGSAARAATAPSITVRHPRGITGLAVSLDGATLATSGPDGTARLWDAASGKPLAVLQGHRGAVAAVAFARGGKTVVTGGFDGTVRLWDASTGKALKELLGHTREVRAVSVSADGSRIASGGADKTVCVWDADRGDLIRHIRPYENKRVNNPEDGVVESVALSPDGQVVASGHRMFDFHVHVWDAGTGVRLADLETENTYVAKVLFSPDGATLAAVSDRGRHIHLWETSTWRLRRRLRFGVDWQLPGAFSPDGWRLAAGAGNAVAFWDLSTGGRVRGPAATLAGGHRAPVRALAFFPDGRRIASAGFDGAAVVWDVAAVATPQPAPPREPLTPTQLEQLWADLAVEDAARSYEAIWSLACAPRQAAEFLGKRLDPEDPVDEQKVRRWLRALDDDDFLARERATKELGRLGDAAEPFLRQALAGKPSIEVSQRVEVLLQAIASPVLDADALRTLRALEALERAAPAAPEARAVLETLAGGGATGSKVKRRAQAAVARLDAMR